MLNTVMNLDDDNKKFYEFSEYWKVLDTTEYTKYMNQKIELILSIIPKEVNTILDAGCGNGVITNALVKRYNVTGVDRSEYALKHLQCQKKINSNLEDLTLDAGSFDLVFCSEVLEHLSEQVFPQCVENIKKLSNKYILVTTPNAETLRKKFTRCHKCGHVFNAYYHFRSFNEEKLEKLFTEHDLIFHTALGKQYDYYNDTLAYIKQVFGNGWWVPDEKFFCPKCENEEFIGAKSNLIAPLCDRLNKIYQVLFGKISAPYWLFALFRRKM